MTGERKELEIRTIIGVERVNAVVFGSWAAHRVRGSDGSDLDYYTVTHVPSGLCVTDTIGTDITRDEAEELAIELSRVAEVVVGPIGTSPTGPGVAAARRIVRSDSWRRAEDE